MSGSSSKGKLDDLLNSKFLQIVNKIAAPLVVAILMWAGQQFMEFRREIQDIKAEVALLRTDSTVRRESDQRDANTRYDDMRRRIQSLEAARERDDRDTVLLREQIVRLATEISQLSRIIQQVRQ